MLKLVAIQGMKLAFIGVALGLLGSFMLTRLMKSLLFGVDTTDPVTFSFIEDCLGKQPQRQRERRGCTEKSDFSCKAGPGGPGS